MIEIKCTYSTKKPKNSLFEIFSVKKLLRYILISSGEIKEENVDPPTSPQNYTLVRVKACGICGTDIHAFHGKHPFITLPIVLGHEFSGVEVESGRRVVVEPSIVCGKCYNCKNGRYNICNELKVIGCQLDGAFAEYVAVPKNRIHLIPDSISFEEGALIEPTAVAVHAVRKAQVKPGDNVVVLGAGPIGLLTLEVCKAFGVSEIIITDISDFRLRLAKELGADYTVNVSNIDLIKWLTQKFGVDWVDCIFECVGGSQDSTINQAIEIARKGTKIIVIGVFSKRIPVNISLIQDRELELIGSLMYVNEDFLTAIKLVHQKKVNVRKLISKIMPMKRINEAFKLIEEERERIIKVVLKFE